MKLNPQLENLKETFDISQKTTLQPALKLTPEIKAKVKQGTPIVLITKKITNSSFEELKNADKYILFEALETDKTKIIYKENSKEQKQEIVLEGNLWELYNFMEIL